MPSKTKNRRNRIRRHRKGTRSQRGGDILHTLSFGKYGTPDYSTTSSDSGWFGQEWWNSLTSTNKPTVIETNANPMHQSAVLNDSTLSNSTFTPNSIPIQTNGYSTGGKKTKSKSCSRKHRHKHTKSCVKCIAKK
jgi:hypothetical protein